MEEVLINDHDYEMVKTDFHQPLLNKNLGGRGEKIQLLFPQMVMSRLGEHMIDMVEYDNLNDAG